MYRQYRVMFSMIMDLESVNLRLNNADRASAKVF